jgi:predicted secreted protein
MAKSTGKINGTAILVDAEGVTIACSTNATLNITNERLETTCKDDGGAKTYEPGSQDWSLELEGITKFDTVSNFSTVAGLAKSKEEVEWVMTTGNPDDPTFTGTGFVGDFTWNAPLNAPSTWSISISPTGPLSLTNT